MSSHEQAVLLALVKLLFPREMLDYFEVVGYEETGEEVIVRLLKDGALISFVNSETSIFKPVADSSVCGELVIIHASCDSISSISVFMLVSSSALKSIAPNFKQICLSFASGISSVLDNS